MPLSAHESETFPWPPGTSKLDRTVHAEFGQDWTGLVSRAETMWNAQVEHAPQATSARLNDARAEFSFEPYQGASTTQAVVSQRIGQSFFRRAVLANHAESCCISGIADPRLLVAGHLKPRGKDIENRHNPANGPLQSATLDKAFDRGLITIDHSRRIFVSRQLTKSPSPQTRDYFARFENHVIRPAARFDPDPAFLDWHNRHCFLDQREA